MTTDSDATRTGAVEVLPREDWQWLADQLRAWPVRRVHPERTMASGALREMAAGVIEAALAATPSPQRADASEMREACATLARVQATDTSRPLIWCEAAAFIERGIRALSLPDRPATDPDDKAELDSLLLAWRDAKQRGLRFLTFGLFGATDPDASPEAEEPALSEAKAREVLATEIEAGGFAKEHASRREAVYGGQEGFTKRLEDAAIRAMIAFARAAAQPQVPEGYVLVPREPTEAMWAEALGYWSNDSATEFWSAMLAAASSPVGEGA